MSKTLATRTNFKIAKTYGAVVTMSAITNATEAVATLGVGHAVVVGDYLEVTSAWGRLNSRIVRVKTVATNDVTLEGVDTADTSKYPSGTGAGSIRRITLWEEITQVKNISSSGGDQQFADATSISDDVEIKIPTIKSARSMVLEVYDDPNLAWYATVGAADNSTAPVGLQITSPNGSKLLANTYWSLMREPNISKNEVITTTINLSFAAASVRYAA